MSNFKDQCDVCKKWDYCKGYNGLILCQECSKTYKAHLKDIQMVEEYIEEMDYQNINEPKSILKKAQMKLNI